MTRRTTVGRALADAPPPLWTIDGLADYLGVPVATIYRWRYMGDGPRGIKIGKHVRFAHDDVLAWIESRKAAG